MVNKVLKLVFFAGIIAAVIFGKMLIDKKTFRYEEVVDTCINKYFITGDVSQLEPLSELLDKYNDDPDFVFNIRERANDVVWSWFEYTDRIYECNKENLNSCKVQLNEFNNLSLRLGTLYNVKTKENKLTLIAQSSYTNLVQKVSVKTKQMQTVIDSPSAKNPLDSEQIRQNKCKAASDCQNCREGVCTCTYMNENSFPEQIRCNNKGA